MTSIWVSLISRTVLGLIVLQVCKVIIPISPLSSFLIPFLYVALLPSVLHTQLHRNLNQGRYEKARLYALLSFVTGPSSHGYKACKLMSILYALSQGKTEPFLTQLKTLTEDADVPISLLAMSYYGPVVSFQEQQATIKSTCTTNELLVSQGYHPLYTRTLVEEGKLSEAIELLQAVEPQYAKSPALIQGKHVSLLFIAAFSGQVDLVKLISGLYFKDSPEIAEYWVATALLHAGHTQEAEDKLKSLTSTANFARKKQIEARLEECQQSTVCQSPQLNESELTQLETWLTQTTPIIRHAEHLVQKRQRKGKIAAVAFVILGFVLLAFAGLCSVVAAGFQSTQRAQASTKPYVANFSDIERKDIHWKFSDEQLKIFEAAWQSPNFKIKGFMPKSPIEGYEYNLLDSQTSFKYQNQKYDATTTDSFSFYKDSDSSEQARGIETDIYNESGQLVSTLSQSMDSRQKTQTLTKLDHNELDIDSIVWDRHTDKPQRHHYHYSRFEFPYTNNPLAFFHQNHFKHVVLGKLYKFVDFSEDKQRLVSYTLQLKEQRKDAKKDTWDMQFQIQTESNATHTILYDSRTDEVKGFNFGALSLHACEAAKVTDARKALHHKDPSPPDHDSKLDSWLIGRAKYNTLKLKLVTDLDDPVSYFENDSQQDVALAPDDSSSVIITLYKKPRAHFDSASVSPQDLVNETMATVQIQSEDPQIQQQARRIVGQETNRTKQALMLAQWVDKNLKWTYEITNDDAKHILKTRTGDCSEHAVLFVAMARALHIPARITGGYRIDSTELGAHAWAEIYDKSWLGIDPSTGEWIDTSYLKTKKAFLPQTIKRTEVLAYSVNGQNYKLNKFSPYWWYSHKRYYNRVLGLIFNIPEYLDYTAKTSYPNIAFYEGDRYQTPQYPVESISNDLFSVSIKPGIFSLPAMIKNKELGLDKVYVRVSDFYAKSGDDASMNAQGAVFNGAHWEKSWHTWVGKYNFHVSRYRYQNGEHGLFYKVPIQNKFTLTFAMFGPIAELKGQIPPPPLLRALLDSIRLVEPDLEAKQTNEEVSHVMFPESK